jgi:sigma-B regulation protein RsbU (phosphoserine phosphatase)
MHSIQQKLSACDLLIVEDDMTNAAILRKHLLGDGYSKLAFATNGKEALDHMHHTLPDMVILDLMMPEMDGFEFLTRMRENPLWANIPIIVQTAIENGHSKIRAFEMGASDYVEKPVNVPELLARIRVHLLNKLLLEEITERQEKMHIEMRAAQMMQERIMPSGEQMLATEETYKLHIARHFETSSVMGGDCWGLQPLTATRLGIYMFDFSGHGMTAAMNVFRMHTLMQELLHLGNDAGGYLTALNEHIHPLLDRSEFATMIYGIIDIEANSLEYAAAAVPPTLVYRPKANSQEWLDSRGFPLGATANAEYETIYTPFGSGDALVMFSDCLIETEDAAGQVMSEEMIAQDVKSALAEKPPHPASHIIDTLITHFRTHTQNPIEDDLTVNVYCRR